MVCVRNAFSYIDFFVYVIGRTDDPMLYHCQLVISFHMFEQDASLLPIPRVVDGVLPQDKKTGKYRLLRRRSKGRKKDFLKIFIRFRWPQGADFSSPTREEWELG